MAYTSYDSIRYNQVRQKSSHNTYQRDEAPGDIAIYWRCRSIEYDIHVDSKSSGQWKIYHSSEGGSNVNTFTALMNVLLGLQTALPDHEVITVFVDNKTNFDTTHTPADLDKIITDALAEELLFTPADLVTYNGNKTPATLQNALAKGGKWPLLSELRGKFMFVITGDDRATYVGDGADQTKRTCFVAQKVDGSGDIPGPNYYVFYNTDTGHADLCPTVFTSGSVSRVYTDYAGTNPDGRGDWNKVVKDQSNHIAVNYTNWLKDSWSTTAGIGGFPFQGIALSINPELTESAPIFGMAVNSKDIEGKKDSFYFWYSDFASKIDQTYKGFISVPGSHTAEWAKGGLMARAATTADSPYFAVLRPAGGKHAMRVQYRLKSGGDTTIVDSDGGPSRNVSSYILPFFGMRISNSGKSFEAFVSLTGSGDFDSGAWTQIGSKITFDTSLNLQGFAASSHDDKDVKFLFGGIGGGTFDFSTFKAIGDDTRAGISFSEVNAPRRELASIAAYVENDGIGHASPVFNVQNAPAHTQILYWRVVDNDDAGGVTYSIYHQIDDAVDTEQYGGWLYDGAFTQNSSDRSYYVKSPAGNNGKTFSLKVMASGLYQAASPPATADKLAGGITANQSGDRASGNLAFKGVVKGSSPSGSLKWTISENGNNGSIKFTIKYDKPNAGDPTVKSNVGNGTVIAKSEFAKVITSDEQPFFYLSSPSNAGGANFLVTVYDVS